MFKVALVYNLKRAKSKELPEDYCSEFDSPETIEAVASALRAGDNQVFLVEADSNLFDWLKSHSIDIVFNTAEGFAGPSRESQVPAILDFLAIPYTGSGVLALALSLDKAKSKQIFISQGIPTPRFQLFKGDRLLFDSSSSLKSCLSPLLEQNLHFPLIVKPNCEGSAKGIHASSKVLDELSLYREIARVVKVYKQDILVEEFIEGKELTVGILGNHKPRILPILEIDFSKCKSKGESFYSWEVKEYQGIDPQYPDPEFFCPARLSPQEEQGIKKVALQAHQALGCLDISRVDIRLSEDSIPYILEVNPLPGLDPKESNIMRMVEAGGISYVDLINGILESALVRCQLLNSSEKEALNRIKG